MRYVKRQLSAAKPQAFAWLGAVAVVLLQLQLAAHHSLDHDALGETGETCEVCLKLDGSGKVPTPVQPLIEIPREPALLFAAGIPAAPAVRNRTHSARAPPRA